MAAPGPFEPAGPPIPVVKLIEEEVKGMHR
eukprot:COSAG05_NODE_13366_length_433_cov_0.742515_1_plen_29_part_01